VTGINLRLKQWLKEAARVRLKKYCKILSFWLGNAHRRPQRIRFLLGAFFQNILRNQKSLRIDILPATSRSRPRKQLTNSQTHQITTETGPLQGNRDHREWKLEESTTPG